MSINSATNLKKDASIVERLVALLSRGNVSLQKSRYATEKKIAARKAAVTAHSFLP